MLNKFTRGHGDSSLGIRRLSRRRRARSSAGCSGDNLSKTETMIENMADGEGKIAAQKEIAAAQDAMLSGKMGACASHLSKAMHVGTAK